MKKCIKCGEELPKTSEYFRIAKANKDGLSGRCTKCAVKADADRYLVIKDKRRLTDKAYYEANKEIINSKNKAYRELNKISRTAKARVYNEENKVHIAERSKAYSEANKEKILAYGKLYRASNKVLLASKYSAYLKTHKEISSTACQRRIARRKNLKSTLSAEQWTKIKLHFNNKCAYCGNEKPLEQEHLCPLSLGGEYAVSNIICACRSCNSSKGAKSFPAWYPQQSFYSKEREKKIYSYLGYKKNVQQLALM